MQRGWARKRGQLWTANWVTWEGGARKQHSKAGFRTKKEVQAFLTSTLAQLQRGEFVEPTKLTFGDYLTDHWLPLMHRSLQPSTWFGYDRAIRHHVLPTLGGVPLQNLSAAHLDQLYTVLLSHGRRDGKPGGLAPKTVRSIHTMLHKALKDAERKQLVLRNVASAADAPKGRATGSANLRTWTGEEVATFLRAMQDHRLYAGYVLAASTGMRRGEVLGLRWRDVDLRARRLAVRQTVTCVNYEVVFGQPKTHRSRRSIALDAVTVAALRSHRAQQWEEQAFVAEGFVDHDLVFCRESGGPIHPDLFSQTFDRTVARIGLRRIRLHDLRHTHATLGLAAGIPAKVMSERLGHSTVAFTQDVYMHTIPQLEEAAADQIAELIFVPSQAGGVRALTNTTDDETILEVSPAHARLIAGWSSGSSLGS